MSRFAAFGIHLGISLAIFLVLAYLVVFEWYPGMFFHTDGGWRGIRIITAVDLVLGPALTLVVFKAGKKGLKMDLTLIGILQVVCLIAGTYVVYSERPIAVVFTDGRFDVMTSDDYTADAGIPVPNLDHIPGDDPKWVMVDMPTDVYAQSDLRKAFIADQRLVSSAVDLYIAFDPGHPLFTEHALDVEVIRARAEGPDTLAQWLAQHGGTIDDYAFYTISSRYAFNYLGFRRDSGEMLGTLSLTAAY